MSLLENLQEIAAADYSQQTRVFIYDWEYMLAMRFSARTYHVMRLAERGGGR
jgi:hypothetical protein